MLLFILQMFLCDFLHISPILVVGQSLIQKDDECLSFKVLRLLSCIAWIFRPEACMGRSSGRRGAAMISNFGAENKPPKTSRLRNNYGAACVRCQRAPVHHRTIRLLNALEYDDSDLALYITCDTTTKG